MKKTDVPDVLQRAAADPYELRDASNCRDIAAEVARLDLALGTDRDVPGGGPKKSDPAATALRVGIEAVIPYRGLIRQITGASAHEKELQKAIEAGFARRGFLKGRALEMKCPAPASPAWYRPPEVPSLPAVPVIIPQPFGQAPAQTYAWRAPVPRPTLQPVPVFLSEQVAIASNEERVSAAADTAPDGP